MARAFSVLCCLIVALQLLVGVPLLVCVVFFAAQGGIGPIALEVHAGPPHSPPVLIHGPTIPPPAVHSPQPLALAPPPNVIPPPATISHDNAILEAREQHGSLLAGTVMCEEASCNSERDLFVAALEKVASQSSRDLPSAEPAIAPISQTTSPSPTECCIKASTGDEVIVQRLYELAELDERAEKFDRADQWRGLAREIRQAGSEPPTSDARGNDRAPAPALKLP